MKRIGQMKGVSKHGNEHSTFWAHFSTMFAGMICGLQKQHSSLRSDSTPNMTTTSHSGF
jgi:hypothetical protein